MMRFGSTLLTLVLLGGDPSFAASRGGSRSDRAAVVVARVETKVTDGQRQELSSLIEQLAKELKSSLDTTVIVEQDPIENLDFERVFDKRPTDFLVWVYASKRSGFVLNLEVSPSAPLGKRTLWTTVGHYELRATLLPDSLRITPYPDPSDESRAKTQQLLDSRDTYQVYGRFVAGLLRYAYDGADRDRDEIIEVLTDNADLFSQDARVIGRISRAYREMQKGNYQAADCSGLSAMDANCRAIEAAQQEVEGAVGGLSEEDMKLLVEEALEREAQKFPSSEDLAYNLEVVRGARARRSVPRAPAPMKFVGLHRPTYFLATAGGGTRAGDIKVQVSTEYRLIQGENRPWYVGLATTVGAVSDLRGVDRSIAADLSGEVFWSWQRLEYQSTSLLAEEAYGLATANELTAGLELETDAGSNVDGERRWLRLYFNYQAGVRPTRADSVGVQLGGRVWIPMLAEPSGIEKFLGYASINLTLEAPLLSGLGGGRRERDARIAVEYLPGRWDRIGSVEVNVMLDAKKAFLNHLPSGGQWMPVGLYFQYWDGYGETLSSFDRRSHGVRFGVGFPVGVFD